MIVRRLAAVAGAALAAGLLPTAPALAHGAPTSPISRTAACAVPGDLATRSAACRVARVANGGPFGSFDNLRVPNVDGRDREVIPDGKLCSGGLEAYQGLDVARPDFPATPVRGGKALIVRYEATLPHKGLFRVYLTRPGYDPKQKLTWDDLDRTPLARVSDPPLTDGAYTFPVTLPSDRTGRHILYVVWQTTSTVDTYYSCSDLVFRAEPTTGATSSARAVSPARGTGSAQPGASSASARDGASSASAREGASLTAAGRHGRSTAPASAPTTRPVAAPPLTPVSLQQSSTLADRAIGGVLLVAVAAFGWAAVTWIRRRRQQNR